jgi:L-ascorbate metabolism protein UlaG (beta-lactamase superfamily)
MGVREGARAASLVRADLVIPCHYSEALGQPADIADLARQVEFLSPGTAVVPLEPGQSVVYTASSYEVRG